MTDEIKIITEGQAKDLILEYALKNGEKTISAHEMQKEVLPELSEDEVEFLFEKIQNSSDNVADIAISEYACLITATGITKRFIEQGGYTKSEKETSELSNNLQRHLEEVIIHCIDQIDRNETKHTPSDFETVTI